jgi:hypothetical protein
MGIRLSLPCYCHAIYANLYLSAQLTQFHLLIWAGPAKLPALLGKSRPMSPVFSLVDIYTPAINLFS